MKRIIYSSDLKVKYIETAKEDGKNAEDNVRDYFEAQDYNVVKLAECPLTVKYQLGKLFDFFDTEFFVESGIPDFFVYRIFKELSHNNQGGAGVIKVKEILQDYRFVEVKYGRDSLRKTQVHWMARHPHLPIELWWVETDDSPLKAFDILDEKKELNDGGDQQ